MADLCSFGKKKEKLFFINIAQNRSMKTDYQYLTIKFYNAIRIKSSLKIYPGNRLKKFVSCSFANKLPARKADSATIPTKTINITGKISMSVVLSFPTELA